MKVVGWTILEHGNHDHDNHRRFICGSSRVKKVHEQPGPVVQIWTEWTNGCARATKVENPSTHTFVFKSRSFCWLHPQESCSTAIAALERAFED